MTCGVYILRFKNTNKVYIGQSLDIESRYAIHRSKLKSNNHSVKLLSAYHIYGMPLLEILIECDISDLDNNETEAISIFNAVDNGFNACKTPGGGNDSYGEDVGNSKFSNIQVGQVFELLATRQDLRNKDIAVLTGVSTDTVHAISGLKVHKWLHTKYPSYYEILLNRDTTVKHAKGKTLAELNKNYPKLISPDGNIYIVDNASKFAKLHNLNNAHIIQVLKGKEKQHKGWKAFYD